jgi:hypothetical protein
MPPKSVSTRSKKSELQKYKSYIYIKVEEHRTFDKAEVMLSQADATKTDDTAFQKALNALDL